MTADQDIAPLPGIHHVTCITGDAQRNVDFYVGVLGLRMVKKTVNFDVPDTYHLYYGDRVGTPGSAMTFFAWPHVPRGRQGSGQVSEVAFSVPDGTLESWSRRLGTAGIGSERADRFDEQVLAFHDPDGLALRLVAGAGDPRFVPWPDSPVPEPEAIRGFHSVTLCEAAAPATIRLLEDTMGFRPTAQEGPWRRFELGAGGHGAIVEVMEDPGTPPGREAIGTVHHVAYRALDDAHQLAWRARLLDAGRMVTPVIDRKYFHSIYFREPGGILFEVATDSPGFLVDETEDRLGEALQLPPQLEGTRQSLDLPPVEAPR